MVDYGVADATSGTTARHAPSLLLQLDLAPIEGLLVRGSGIGNSKKIIGDLAVNYENSHFAIDAEGFFTPNDYNELQKAAFYTGLAFNVNDHFQIAGRYDNLSEDDLPTWVPRYGVGFSHTLFDAILYAAEYSYDDKDGNAIAFQLGLKSTLKLPGFQRRTLTRD